MRSKQGSDGDSDRGYVMKRGGIGVKKYLKK